MKKNVKNERYGRLFREARNERNLTPKEVARGLCFWSENSLRDRELGLRSFNAEELYRAYVVFGIDIGFSKAFSAIAGGQVEEYFRTLRLDRSLVSREFLKNLSLTQGELSPVCRRSYRQIRLETLEKIRTLVDFCESPSAEDTRTRRERELEQHLLLALAGAFERRDGSLQNVIQLLQAELDYEILEKISELAQCRF